MGEFIPYGSWEKFVELSTVKTITICIAAYKYDARPLLESLKPAWEHCHWPVEVLLGDDGSGEPWSSAYDHLAEEFGLRIVRPAQNIGRAGIRNLLAREAKMQGGGYEDWLLFLDVDSLIPTSEFLNHYAEATFESGVEDEQEVCQDADLVVGGTLYTAKQEGAGNLRHRYGMAREMANRSEPKADAPGLALNNLFIRSSTYWQAGGLDESIRTYGHEDTLLGKNLKKLKLSWVWSFNPVLHTGLETDTIFLNKSLEAARNLARLHHTGKLGPEDARLIYTANRFQAWGLDWFPGLVSPLFPKSSLIGLDARKLAAFLKQLKG